MSAHIHAALMAQYAQDAAETDRPWERWEYKFDCEDEWQTPTYEIGFLSGATYRRKPRTHMVNGIEVPAPMSDAPNGFMPYWVSDPSRDGFCIQLSAWEGDPSDIKWLERGLAHATKEAAVANAMAMIGRRS